MKQRTSDDQFSVFHQQINILMVLFCFFMLFARFQILICEPQSICKYLAQGSCTDFTLLEETFCIRKYTTSQKNKKFFRFFKILNTFQFQGRLHGFFYCACCQRNGFIFKTFRILFPYFKAILSFRDSFIVSLQKKGRKFYSSNET